MNKPDKKEQGITTGRHYLMDRTKLPFCLKCGKVNSDPKRFRYCSADCNHNAKKKRDATRCFPFYKWSRTNHPEWLEEYREMVS